MGITIEETIEFYNGLECYTPQAKDARDVAIDTMCKYQKIQEIFYRYDKGELTHNMFGLLVGEVLEDGKDT